jgi:TPR repeat protein
MIHFPVRWLIVLLITISPTVCALGAESVATLKNQAKNFYFGLRGEQNYNKALKLYLKAAGQGDAEAQYIAGGMYYRGFGTAKDIKKGTELLLAAAQHGVENPDSNLLLGQAFFLGSVLPRNYDKALQWYTKAADGGNAEAQNELGFIYYSGKGVTRDLAKGAAYFVKAAQLNLPIAQYNAGLVYFSGNGVESVDLAKAYGWMSLASANGYAPASSARDYIEPMLTTDELRQAQNFADQIRTTLPLKKKLQ